MRVARFELMVLGGNWASGLISTRARRPGCDEETRLRLAEIRPGGLTRGGRALGATSC